ncbi:hypothetical protein HD806DRAFT_489736 [Xylariaceae sp. AK1471]|nr:hypothetical protein HD806DRAFT_489736 [Xylariaceae sp. AK1471]
MARVNRVTAYQKDQNIDFSTSSTDPLASWRISGIKGPVFEQWYFDSVADDGKSGIVFTLARDASYALLGQGHLRVELDVVFSDGTHFNHVDWMSEAVIQESKSGQVDGTWTANDKTYKHAIAPDGSRATVEMNTPQVKGHFVLSSLSPSVYPDGQTHDELASKDQPTSTELLPKIHLVQVIPTATFEADLMFQGRPLRFRGIGGHMHIWAAGSWFDTTPGWRVCRGVAGPWSVTCMEFTSMDGTVHSSGYVAKDGQKHFGELEVYREEDPPSLSKVSKRKQVRWLPTYNTGLSGPFDDKSTGCVLHFTSGKPGNEYKFELTHKRTAFDVWFGSNSCGLSSFLGDISGGKVGEETYRGVQFTDVCRFPQGLAKVFFFFCMILAKLSFGYINVLGINT